MQFFLAIQYPREPGLISWRFLRKTRNDITFIFFTGRRGEVTMEAQNNGSDRYIVKSASIKIMFEELLRAIILIVERRRYVLQDPRKGDST